MKLTDLLRRTAEANPQAATLHSIADKAEELVEKRYSVRRMLREMESFAHDTKAMRLIVDALRQLPYLPTLEQVDYKPYIGAAALLKRGQFKDHSSCRDDRFGQLRRGGTAGARFFGQSFQAVLDFRADGGNRPICNERGKIRKTGFFLTAVLWQRSLHAG